jgi:hypothetical protein
MLGTVLATVNVEFVRAEPSAATSTALRTNRGRGGHRPRRHHRGGAQQRGRSPGRRPPSCGSTDPAPSAVASLPLMPSRPRARRWGPLAGSSGSSTVIVTRAAGAAGSVPAGGADPADDPQSCGHEQYDGCADGDHRAPLHRSG